MTQEVALWLLFTTTVMAQTSAQSEFGIGEKLKQNSESLKLYSFKRRTDIHVKGKSRGARVDLVRYVDGKLEVVPLETPARSAEQARPRGVRGKIVEKKIEKKKEEMKADVERLTSLLHRYTSPGSEGMRTMLEKASVSRVDQGPDADVKVVATGVSKPSDSFTLIWSVANHRPAKIEIRADLDGKPVAITVEYAALPDGLFYAARTIISLPKKDVTVNIDTFDYTRSVATR